jgi:hypothetical protein
MWISVCTIDQPNPQTPALTAPNKQLTSQEVRIASLKRN